MYRIYPLVRTTAWAILFIFSMNAAGADDSLVLRTDSFRHYIDEFGENDEELYAQHVSNDQAWDFLKANIPLLECPDKDVERTYYFRWWTYRKHIKKTSDGFVITEFLPQVPWAGKHNTISCPAGHHFYEGRWLHDNKYLDDYAIFWFRKGGEPRRYSFWAADALWARYMVTQDKDKVTDLLDDLVNNYEQWEQKRLEPDGLFWQIDHRDGMEVSVGGTGKRATINSYMYSDATAISEIAALAGREDVAERFREKARKIKVLVQTKLWDDKAKFFKTLPRDATTLVDVREQHGYTPWYFNLPDAGRGYEIAWKQLMDPKGFYAPFGPTTAEQRHPGFKISYEGHQCQWNGPSWPLSTAVTLTALANVLNNYEQNAVSKADYFETLKIYTKSHRLKRQDGSVVPWIDENLNPYTGDWIARTRLKDWKDGTWDERKGGKERGKDYNHSSYCDLIISGLAGLRPQAGDIVEVNPLVPARTWDWFCLDNVPYHGRIVTILWDKTGDKYGKGKGLSLFADGKEIARSETITRIKGKLPPTGADGMTYHRAKQRIPKRHIPRFWVGNVADISAHFAKLADGDVTVIATSPGGRPVHLIEYGQIEKLQSKANFNSAIGGRKPSAYMDKAERKKPVILLVGPVHGAEVEGLTGLVNFINVMETGKDLRGKNHAELRALGRQCRLLIIPDGNPDGIARFEPQSLCGMTLNDLKFWGQGTWSDDTFCGWPQSKRQHPMVGDNTGFLGCYFNDKGVNPMHDEFFDAMGPEAPAILRVAREEGPDLAVSLHCHANDPALLRPAYVTTEIQQDIRSLAQRCYELLAEQDLPHGSPFTVKPEGGKNPSSFNLTSAMYHVSGANSFTFECPHGLTEGCQVNFEQILDIQLTLYEAMMRHEIEKKEF